MKKEKKNKSRLFSILICIASLLMGIGYASISDIGIGITGNINAKEQENLFITDISCYQEEGYDNSICSEKYIDFATQTYMNTNIALDNNQDSSITYQITLYNSTDTIYYFDSATYMNDEMTYNNENIIYELRDKTNTKTFEKGVELVNGEYLTFNIIFKYKEGADVTQNMLNSYLYFKFNASYILSYDANGGTTQLDSKRVINTYTYGSLPEVTRAGYIFDGWYTSASGGTLIKEDTIVDLNENTTIYAHWICNTFAPEATWYNRGSTPRNNITEIEFIKDYIPTTYTDSWNIDIEDSGSLKAYVIDGTKLIINVSVEDIIYANPNSSYMFSGHTSYTETNRYFINLTNISGIELLDTSLSTTMYKMFYYCNNLTYVNLLNFNTAKVTNMASMFTANYVINNLDFSNFKTNNVTNLSEMFRNCNSITSLDLQNFNTSKVTDMSFLFSYMHNLKNLNISNFDLNNVTSLAETFAFLSSIESIQFPQTIFKMPKLKSLKRTFYESQLESIDLSFITNTTALTDMSNMFTLNQKLTSIKFSDELITSNVTNMGSMFAQCESLTTLDLSMFDTSKVEYFSYISTTENPKYLNRGMFTGNTKLKTIYVSDKFVTTKATDTEIGSTNMFLDCTSLVGGNGTTYDANYTDKTYARIDGVDGLPGYFTLKQ